MGFKIMNTWTPVFSKIVDSSLWSEEDYVCKVFVTMMALKDADQVVRFNAYAIGRKCWPLDPKAEEKVIKALKILSSPDRKRIEPQPHDGRRLQKVEDGWFILNGQKYEDLMRSINRRNYKAKKQREYRARVNGRPLPGEDTAIRALENGHPEVFDSNSASQESLDVRREKAEIARQEAGL